MKKTLSVKSRGAVPLTLNCRSSSRLLFLIDLKEVPGAGILPDLLPHGGRRVDGGERLGGASLCRLLQAGQPLRHH
jgi:hypothetical protein